jgi:hypothetical protein
MSRNERLASLLTTPDPGIEEPEVFTEIQMVTARDASYWLERNAVNNRDAKPAKIAKYARDMANDRWMITGDTIKITPDGIMIDGGQRMRSVLRAHAEYPDFKGVRMMFARNVPYRAILVTDNNSARTFADALKIEDAINRNNAGAIVRRVHVWQQGNPAFLRGSGAGFVDPTLTELLELYRSDRRQFDAAAQRGLDIRNARVGNVTAAGTAYYMLNKINHDAAMNFFDDLVSGAHSNPRYPIWTLRERLVRAHSRLDRADYLTPTEQMYFIVRAWNAWLRDEPLDRMQLPGNRDINNLNFPTPLDPAALTK